MLTAVFGDSLTTGSSGSYSAGVNIVNGVATGTSYACHLVNHPNIEVSSSSKAFDGHSTTELRPKITATTSAEVAIFLLGNEVRCNIQRITTRENLEGIFAFLGAKKLLLLPTPPRAGYEDATLDQNAWLKRVAAHRGWWYADDVWDDCVTPDRRDWLPGMSNDGTHQTVTASGLMAARLIPQLLEIGSL